MGIGSWLTGIFGSVVADSVSELTLNRPKITIPSSEGWEELKQVNTYVERDYSTDSDYFVQEELKSRDYYRVYGIQIRNDKFVFSGVNAKLTNVTIKLWNSDGSALTEWYDGRFWGGRKNPANDPLFPKERINNEREIGEGQELDIVIAYNQENEAAFYKFTIETHLQDNFKVYKDLFRSALPLYGVARLHGHRIANNKIYFSIAQGRENSILKIDVLREADFPLAKEEVV